MVNSRSSNYKHTSDCQDNSDCKDRSGTILQQAAYYLRASDSYRQAKRFKPLDDNIEILQQESYENYVQELNRCKDPYNKTNFSVKDNDKKLDEAERKKLDKAEKKLDKAVEDNQLSEYLDEFNFSFLIDLGDRKRLNEDLEYQSESDKKNALTIAYRCYDRAICEQPEHPLGWYFRGLAQSELGQLKKSEKELREAIKDFNKALEQKEDLSWAFYDRGIAHYRIAEIQPKVSNNQEDNEKKEYHNALKDFVQAIRINSEYDDAWYYRGLVLACMERYESAIASFDRTIQICQEKKQTKDEIKAWYDRGKSYKELGEQEEAIASFIRAISVAEKLRYKGKDDKLFKKFTGEYERLRKEYKREKSLNEFINEFTEKWEELKKEFQKEQEKYSTSKSENEPLPEPSHVNSLFQWGVILYESRKYKDAIKKLKAVKKFEENEKFKEANIFCDVRTDTYYYWIKALCKDSDNDRLNNFEQHVIDVTSLNPKHVDSCYRLGFIYYILGEQCDKRDYFDEAIAKFEKVTELNPNHIDGHYYCGLALYNSGKYEEVIDKLDRVIGIADQEKQKDKISRAYYHIIMSYFVITRDYNKRLRHFHPKADNLDLIQKAIEYCKKALDFNSNHTEASNLLCQLLQEKEEIYPAGIDVESQYRWGVSLYKLEKYKDAKQKFKKVTNNPNKNIPEHIKSSAKEYIKKCDDKLGEGGN